MLVNQNIEFFSCLFLIHATRVFTLYFLKNNFGLKHKINTRVKDIRDVSLSVLFLLMLISDNKIQMNYLHTNQLINSTSPYLLQHAHNPVNWNPWSENIVEKAKNDDKLLLVSIGYAACHWCHVMEHESFENEQVAQIMNDNFICIKVDREERPDIDHYYMTAVQLMQQQGGWPLNVIALPDGRPIWGGTYFPKENWMKSLQMIADFYRKNRLQTEEYASNLQNGIEQASLIISSKQETGIDFQMLENAVTRWKKTFDMENGGRIGAPKFPMPVNLDFLLYYGFMSSDEIVLNYVETTLLKIARGGIYDQIGGGFARYSVDEIWKVPHFEKMLYDNGQLLSIYSKGFQQFRKHEFKTVVYETVDFIERELMDESDAFYSSLDADSEGEEGKFYVWKSADLKKILKEEYDLFSLYFQVNKRGFWENGNSILLRDNSDEIFAENNSLSPEQLSNKVTNWKKTLLDARSKRVRPGLDDKTLISWNAIVIQGLADAYIAFGEIRFIELAIRNATFITENILQPDGKLFHSWKQGKITINGFLEDYALIIQAYISLFEITGDEQWLKISGKLTDYCFNHFHDERSGLFYFAEKKSNSFVTNHFQNEDNVIPAANSVMANNLHKLYLIFGKPEYMVFARQMLRAVIHRFTDYPMAFANWGTLMLKMAKPFYEVAVTGDNAKKVLREMRGGFHPNVLWVFSNSENNIPVLKDRMVSGKTLIYVCIDGMCKLPVKNPKHAIDLIG